MVDLTGTISYFYDNGVEMIPKIFLSLAVAICFVALTLFAISILNRMCSSTKSKQYRELIADMYVVGKIKKFAEEDEVNVLEELKEFKLICKEEQLKKFKNIDDAVESYLNSKISESSVSKLNK